MTGPDVLGVTGPEELGVTGPEELGMNRPHQLNEPDVMGGLNASHIITYGLQHAGLAGDEEAMEARVNTDKIVSQGPNAVKVQKKLSFVKKLEAPVLQTPENVGKKTPRASRGAAD